MGAYVESVNTGRIREVPWGSLRRSAIDKRPVEGAVAVTPYGLAGDEIADLRHHGGLDQAVYAYAAEDLEAWASELGRELRHGQFGENLTTRGVDVTGSRIGERWRVGTTLLEVCSVRTPCRVFAGFLDEQRWARRFTERGVPGAYLRVVEPGDLSAGDAIDVVDVPAHDVTVGMVFRALTTERTLLPRLLEAPAVAAEAREKAERYVAAEA
ncbi:MOSC domain-containing protein [Mumia zhuanghuii]|uniref:MOSC domain-containing protein n=2 Tax=Mumia TaxID=1546255 RepID=A0ABW1QK54_9ACTN|nr:MULTISPECIES: MOSC domain-containing protein [Mumia]KAA1423663.1 MOSC domain-containing protein [Mumia zhuanghuii]